MHGAQSSHRKGRPALLSPSSPLRLPPSSFRPHPFRQGFTLIEILVVIAIIGILIALLMPAIRKLLLQATRTRAAAQVIAVANAVSSYRTVYSKWPGQTAASADGTIANDLVLTNLLVNPRGQLFLEPEKNWVQGVPPRLVDNWKRDLQIAMDENGSGGITVTMNPPGGASFSTTVVSRTVLVWSWGHNPKDPSMWIMSWTR